MAKKKTRHFTEEEFEELIGSQYNQGREHADIKWIDAINARIAALEREVGIPELRRLREKVKYRWKEREDKTKQPLKLRRRRR